MKSLRKAISVLLCLCLCMGLLPAAFAEEPAIEDVLTWENEAAVEANAAKPTITAQPKDTSAVDGTQATFTITASGTGLSYQWQYRKSASGTWTNSTAASGTTKTFIVNARTAIDGYQYRCKVTNTAGSVTSSIVTLTVLTKPAITTQPKNVTAADGTIASFTVAATGGALKYQWQYRTSSTGSWTNSTAESGTTKSYYINARTAINGYQYRCRITNAAGSATSSIVTLTVSSSAVTKPTITTQPKNFSAPDGTQTTVSVTATGTNLKYRWQYRKNSSSAWTDSSAASANTKTLTVNARTAINGYQYRCIVSNSAGSVTSSVATLTVTAGVAKPTITTQPKNVTAADGTTTTFTIAASGTGLSYQWQYRKTSTSAWTNSTAASGTTKTFSVNARTAINGYQYRCKVTNAGGTVTSSIVTLTVVTKPTITTQPKNVTAADGTTATFTIAASGTGLSYQWQYRTSSSGSWTNSTSASGTTATFNVNARTAIDGYQYRCKVTNAGGTVTSSIVKLTVITKPTITTQPTDVTAGDGMTATFTIAASGTGLSYQWQYRRRSTDSWTNSTAASGKTKSYTVNVRTELNGYQYRCKVTNAGGTTISSIVTLTVVAKPTITTQPKNVTAVDGTTATFTIAASGAGLSYRWQYRTSASGTWTNSTSPSGQTKDFSVNARTEINGYQYRCRVTNAGGTVTSSIVTLTVRPATVAINTTNFPDAKFREVVKTFDTDKDNTLSAAEIEAVQTIDCATFEMYVISSLEGIEYFDELTTLYAGYQHLTRIDVSKNTKLRELRCDYNNLTSLDVSKNTALETLICSGNNISTLTLGNCKNLLELDLFDNNMQSLDLSAATALTKLDCSKNLLRSISLKQNTELIWLQCIGNQFESLDLSKNTKLTFLNCTDNDLTELDVSMIPALSLAITRGTRSTYGTDGWHYDHEKGDVIVDKAVELSPADPNPDV